MTDRSPAETEQWSLALRDRYRCTLTDDLTDWFDGGYWRREKGGEFDQPILAESLLEDAPEFLWPGFMLPDSVPLLGNRYGDWLCLRFDNQSSVSEVVHWYHGGGDWMPWGRNLAEAVAFDSLRSRLPGRRQYYANIAAEFDQQFGADSIPAWAREHLPVVGAMLVDPSETGDEVEGLADLMIKQNVASIAVRCECILAALDSPMREKLTPNSARALGANWEPDVVRWLFDEALVPRAILERMKAMFACESSDLLGQDWTIAEAHAKHITADRSDLGWAHEIVAWTAERRHDHPEAIGHYQNALLCSSFADQSVRFRTHWFPECEGKFAASRLQHLITDQHQLLSDPYLTLFLDSKAQGIRNRVTLHWTRVAEDAAAEERWADAYDAYFKAGWDMGCDDLGVYRELLKRLAECAENSGQYARAEIAKTHLACLLNRMG